MAVCVLGMAKRTVDNPGDHLLDCLRQPRKALERAARRDIPLKETAFVAVIGLLGLGWALSGLVLGQFAAFERFVLGAGLGLATIAPLALYLGAMNALQPPGDGPPATLKTSFAIFVTSLVGPSVVTLSMGIGGLALTSWVEAPWAAATPALVALAAWTIGLVVNVGIGHALRRGGSSIAGIGTAVAALLVTALATALAVFILMNPPWATEETWKFL